MQLKQVTSRALTIKSVAVVTPQLLLVLLPVVSLKLHAYPPMYTTLIDPPYEFAALLNPTLVVTAQQLTHAASMTLTIKPLAVVAPQLLMLAPTLHVYPPIYATLIDPPYELAPREKNTLDVKALQLKHGVSRTLTLKPLAVVAPQMLLVLPPVVLLKLHAYPPICTTLIDPP